MVSDTVRARPTHRRGCYWLCVLSKTRVADMLLDPTIKGEFSLDPLKHAFGSKKAKQFKGMGNRTECQ